MEPKETQGQQKLLRYLNDLIRNKQFLVLLKRLGRYEKQYSGSYYEWSEKEKKRHDEINTQIGPIINDFVSLKKRANKLTRDRAFAIKEKIAEQYGLTSELLRTSMTRNIKNFKTNYRYLKLKCLNTVKQIMNTKILLL